MMKESCPDRLLLSRGEKADRKAIFACATYLAMLILAELCTLAFGSSCGLGLHLVILFATVIGAASSSEHSFHKLILVLSLAPILRISELAVPLPELSELLRYAIMSVPMLIGIITVVRILDLRPRDIGLTVAVIPIQALVVVMGIAFGMIDYLILDPEPLITELTFREMIGPAIVLMLTVGLIEEIIFRGVMQRAAYVLGSKGWVCIAIIYAVIEIRHGSVLHCLFALVISLCFGWVVDKTKSILGVSLAHGTMTVGLYLLFPFIL